MFAVGQSAKRGFHAAYPNDNGLILSCVEIITSTLHFIIGGRMVELSGRN